MKKPLAVAVVLAAVMLLGWRLAVGLELVGPPNPERLAREAAEALDAYADFVSGIQDTATAREAHARALVLQHRAAQAHSVASQHPSRTPAAASVLAGALARFQREYQRYLRLLHDGDVRPHDPNRPGLEDYF